MGIKRVPFAASEEFMTFADEFATAEGISRNGLLRQALKFYARNTRPALYGKHFPDEVVEPLIQEAPEEVQTDPTPQVNEADKPAPIVIPNSAPRVAELFKGDSDHEDDFLSQIDHEHGTSKFGAPDQCPSCEVPRYEYDNGVVVKTNVSCGTNPDRGRWVCTECASSGEYFPDKEATID